MTLSIMTLPGPTASPIPLAAFGTAVVDNVNELITDLTPILSVWTQYTPTWTSASNPQPSVGNAVFEGRYVALGKVGFMTVKLVGGTTTTWGTGKYFFSLPPGWTSATTTSSSVVIGEATIGDFSPATNYLGVASILSAATTLSIDTNGASLSLASTVPFTFNAGDTDSIAFRAILELA